ncbi:MAG: DMT family transporter [Phycisphaerales bacterium]|nr:DMT family transporter [Phycisphaerales bacterium]
MLSDPLIGSLAATGAAACWVITALAIAEAGRRVGSALVNVSRLLVAVVLLGGIHRLVFGTWWPSVPGESIAWLAASGIIGLGIGDQLLFQALVDAGSRITTLLLTLAPPITAILAWPVLDETLSIIAILGMAITLGGIAWVVSEQTGSGRHPHPRRGILLGAGAGIAQAVGLILAKLGMDIPDEAGATMNPWSATLVRIVFGVVMAFILLILLRIQARDEEIERAPMGTYWRVPALILIGAIFGPVLGVWLSLVGIDNVETAIAATLMSLSPVFIIPFAAWIEKDRITGRAIIGAIISVIGVAVLAFGLPDEEIPMTMEPDEVPQASSTSLHPGSTS